MAGKLVCLQDYEKHAEKVLPTSIFEFYKGGANQEQTLKDNHEAFKRWRLVPRVLRGLQNRTLNTTVLGNIRLSAPIGIAPTAMHRMAHEDGECATARAAAKQGIVYTMSTIATSSIEEIAKAAPDGINWFQLCIFKDRQATANLVRRAERANFKALVVTVDAGLLGRRLASERNGFHLPSHLRLGNFDIPEDQRDQQTPNKGSKFTKVFDSTFDPCLTWADIDWLKRITALPIVLKGILSPDDAEIAVQHGVAAIEVSNHGGRQLDGVQATIDALPGIVKQVNGRCEVFVDGGVTQGTDILKALALGARMAFIGRPALWGLAHSGQEGVDNIIQLLKLELDLAMALSGCSSVDEIVPSLLLHNPLGFDNLSKM